MSLTQSVSHGNGVTLCKFWLIAQKYSFTEMFNKYRIIFFFDFRNMFCYNNFYCKCHLRKFKNYLSNCRLSFPFLSVRFSNCILYDCLLVNVFFCLSVFFSYFSNSQHECNLCSPMDSYYSNAV